MDVLDTLINGVLLILIGALISWQLSGRFKAFETRFQAFDARFQALEGRMDTLQRSVDGMRSDLTRVALAVGMRPESETGA
jgi:hypothetical protein